MAETGTPNSLLPHSLRKVALCALLAALPVQALADPRDDARRHFASGLSAAANNDYRTAADEFLAAYGAIPHGASAFNIARAFEDLDEFDDALFWYRKFQEHLPDRASEADGPIARIEAHLDSLPETIDALLSSLRELDGKRGDIVSALQEAGVEPEPDPEEGSEGIGPNAQDPTGAATPLEPESQEGPTPVTTGAAPPKEAFLTDAYEKVVVTASRYGQDPLDSPSSITVLTQEDIRLSGAVHIADVLRRVVGVDVMAMSSGVPYLGIRGFNSEMTNKVLWLIDGRPAYLEFLATALSVTMPVAMEEIERIEVIRGPGSAIYGANAVTGVINIITRQPGEGPAAIASVSGGLNSLISSSAVASGRLGPVGYRMSAGYQQEGRFQKEVDEIVDGDNVIGFRRDQDLGDQRVRAAARFDTRFADKGWASLSGGWSSGFTEYYSKAALGNFGLEGQIGHIRGDIAYGPFHMRGYWQREAGRTAPWLASAGSPRATEAYVLDDAVDLEAEGNFDVNTGPVDHRIHFGAGYTYKRFRAGLPGEGFEIPRTEHHGKGFVQYQLGYEWLTAQVSLRLDKHPLLKLSDTISPRGALVFRVGPNTSIRTSAGTSFRAMNGLESYVNLSLNTGADGYFVNFFGGVTNPAGETLGPERVTTVELGVRDESTKIHAVDGAVYWNRVTDLIDIGSVQPKLAGYDPENTGYPFGEARWFNDSDSVYDSVGGELDFTLYPVDGLDLFANVALETIIVTTPDETFNDRSTALAHTNFGVMYRSPWRIDLSMEGHYVSKQVVRVPQFDERGIVQVDQKPLPDRFLMSTRVAGRVWEAPDIELAMTLWNPLGFGKGFREHPDGQIVGPRLFGTLTVEF